MIDMLLANALLACPLALIAWFFGRRAKSPALAHALWLIVLLKLVSPPLVELPLSRLGFASVQEEATREKGGTDLASLEVGSQLLEELALYEAMLDDPSLLEAESETADAGPEDAASTAASSPFASRWLGPLGQIALGMWLLGSVLVTALAVTRVRRFRRLLARGRPAPRELRRRLRRLANRIGLRALPRSTVVEAQVSPMLWGLGSATTLVLPAGLEAMLSRRELETLLLHELAHLKRRDHWVRFIELLAVALYWWNPVLWLCRRELRRREEECCDAWVVSTLPEEGRNYARALVTCIDFVAGVPRPVAPGASAMGSAGFMKRRVEMILRPRSRAGLDPRARFALVLMALVAIPILPVFGQEREIEEERQLREIREERDGRSQLRPRRRAIERRSTLMAEDDLESVIHTLEVVIEEIVAGGKSPRAARITQKLRGAIERLQRRRATLRDARRNGARGEGRGRRSRSSARANPFDEQRQQLRELEDMERALKEEANLRERELALHARELEERVRELELNQRAIMERRDQIEAHRRAMQADIEKRRRDLEVRMGELNRIREQDELNKRAQERRQGEGALDRTSRRRSVERDLGARRRSRAPQPSTSVNLDREFAQLEDELAKLRSRGLTDATPEVGAVRARMAEIKRRKSMLRAELFKHRARLAELEGDVARAEVEAKAEADKKKEIVIRRSQIERVASLETLLAECAAKTEQLKKAGDLAAAKKLQAKVKALEEQLAALRAAMRNRGKARRLRIVDDRGATLEVIEEREEIEEVEETEEIIEEVEVEEEVIEEKPAPRRGLKPGKTPRKTLKLEAKHQRGR
jgi:beta-lactamase regulating signal transducer with metallopeptidase domain